MSAPAVTPAAHRTKPPRDLGAQPLTMATTTSPTSASSVPLPLLHRRRGILGHVPPEAPVHALRPPRGHQAFLMARNRGQLCDVAWRGYRGRRGGGGGRGGRGHGQESASLWTVS
ncbi:ubiquitin carrier protein 7 [Zea mays]|uniref:Ubiquitin carrier protein 7 n=1 Tax=Zea mays TaxID=4577 RepID=A0A1D6EQ84_MAIZE|nr:ubiquitin carrier protein 7 [Zea mays]ONM21974.1 ubiquitin carrier protein 7 [Zea mays]ONM22017.1 ubiquitin carrier protein 7 [Zea mays]ONM22075.1 ubiquitin carrier protein 7 [Zea mays]